MEIKEFQKQLELKGIDFALFYSRGMEADPNFRYFSAFNSAGTAIIGKKPFLLVPKMEMERAKRGNIRQVYAFDKKRAFQSAYEIVKKKRLRHKKIGIDKNSLTLNAFKALKKHFKSKFADVSDDYI